MCWLKFFFNLKFAIWFLFLLRIETGPVGTVYTTPAYRKRGFGSAIVKSIFKQIAETGYGVTACVKEANLSSRAIFEKIGCQIIGEVYWMEIDCMDATDFDK